MEKLFIAVGDLSLRSPRNSMINISQFNISRKNLSIYGAYSYSRTMRRALELVKNKKINLLDIISHRYKLTEFNKALKTVKAGPHLRIILDCNG